MTYDLGIATRECRLVGSVLVHRPLDLDKCTHPPNCQRRTFGMPAAPRALAFDWF